MTQAQGLPPVVVAAERGNQEMSSGGGELSDSLSVGEVGVTRLRKKKAKVSVYKRVCVCVLNLCNTNPCLVSEQS